MYKTRFFHELVTFRSGTTSGEHMQLKTTQKMGLNVEVSNLYSDAEAASS